MNWLAQHTLRNEARRMAEIVSVEYPKAKAAGPEEPEQEVILSMAFERDALGQISEESRNRILACCETIQGFCYMMVLDAGSLKEWMNLRSLQFTHYMDKELEARGFPSQSKEQKERILEAMELRIDGWERISHD